MKTLRFSFTALHLSIFTILFLLLSVAGRAEWDPTHPDPMIEYHYSYDGVGNITKIEDRVNNSTSTFTYDEVDRLTQAVGPYGANGAQQTQSYSYDVVGDNLDVPLPGPSDRDGNGNITNLNGKTIEYDYENRPIKITETTGIVTEFGYDYSGQRVWKAVTASGTTSETLYVGNIYEIYISTSGTETQTAHIYAGSMKVASRVTQNSMSRTYYYLGDHLGSTRMTTDALGQVVQNITYAPWGNTVTESSTTYKSDYKFTGQALDDSTGLYYYGARYYDPQLRRFITPDTIVQSPYDPQSLNRYAYCRNNPLNLVDPTGHWSLRNFYKEFAKIAMPGVWMATTGEGRQWWNKNRDYVAAGAIIVGTGGMALGASAAWSPVLWGAFSGELVGGYSAYQAGGDIISGVVVGGAVGAITGYAGYQASTFIRSSSIGASHFGYALSGAVRGGIIGAGSGGVAGYKGGAGTSDSIIRGMYRGAALGAAAGGAFGYLEYSPGKGFGDVSTEELGNSAKEAGMRGIKSAAESKDIGAIPGNILKESLKEFGPLMANTLANYPDMGNAIISLAVGAEETNYLIERYGINGKIKIEF